MIIAQINIYVERVEDKYNQKLHFEQTSRSEFIALLLLFYSIGTMQRQNANVQQTNAESGKPELILDYNKSKGSVDICDKMCSVYSVYHIKKFCLLSHFVL